MGITTGVPYQQRMPTPLKYLIPPLVYPKVCLCSFLWFVFPVGSTRLMTLCYLCSFIQNSEVNNVWNVIIIPKANTKHIIGKYMKIKFLSFKWMTLIFSGKIQYIFLPSLHYYFPVHIRFVLKIVHSSRISQYSMKFWFRFKRKAGQHFPKISKHWFNQRFIAQNNTIITTWRYISSWQGQPS
jgi:hypothetical protein